MSNLLALINGWSVGQTSIAIVVAAAIIALLYVGLEQFGITVPDWVKKCVWIIIVAFVIIFSIRLVLSM
jgi:hypothetical protein